MERSNTPRQLVSTTSLSTSSGNNNESTPAPAQKIHFNRSALLHAARNSLDWKSQPSTTSAPAMMSARLLFALGNLISSSDSSASRPGTSRAASAPMTTMVGSLLIVYSLVDVVETADTGQRFTGLDRGCHCIHSRAETSGEWHERETYRAGSLGDVVTLRM